MPPRMNTCCPAWLWNFMKMIVRCRGVDAVNCAPKRTQLNVNITGWRHLRSKPRFCFGGINFPPIDNKKSKVLPYSLPSVEPGADPVVQEVSLQVTISHSPAVGCHYFLPGLRFTFVSVCQMAPPLTEVTDNLLLIYRPRRDKRVSWPGWLKI